MKNKDVIEQFARGKREGKGNSVFIEGNVIYSYGHHFPMAIRLFDTEGFKFIWNRDHYSQTTKKCQNWLFDAIGGKDKIVKEVITPQMEHYKKFTSVREVILEALD